MDGRPGGCGEDDEVLFELNPDARRSGWAPSFGADDGGCNCGGLCGTDGHELGLPGDFAKEPEVVWYDHAGPDLESGGDPTDIPQPGDATPGGDDDGNDTGDDDNKSPGEYIVDLWSDVIDIIGDIIDVIDGSEGGNSSGPGSGGPDWGIGDGGDSVVVDPGPGWVVDVVGTPPYQTPPGGVNWAGPVGTPWPAFITDGLTGPQIRCCECLLSSTSNVGGPDSEVEDRAVWVAYCEQKYAPDVPRISECKKQNESDNDRRNWCLKQVCPRVLPICRVHPTKVPH